MRSASRRRNVVDVEGCIERRVEQERGVGAAIANAIYNATGIRVRDYPITPDKLLDRLPPVG
jgi:hypothetical protein